MSQPQNNPDPIEHETNRLPTFIISVGTQVVLKSAKRVPGTDIIKPVGSVAEVLEAPASNSRPYLIRFVDGVTMRVKLTPTIPDSKRGLSFHSSLRRQVAVNQAFAPVTGNWEVTGRSL
jgi:hypothetical protein